jgi:putative lipoprotein
MKALELFLAATLALLGGACDDRENATTMATTSGGSATIEGTATYRERIAMPQGALFEAILEDVSRTDAASIEIAKMEIASPPNPPIPFTISYDTTKIDAGHSYSVRTRLLLNGKIIFSSDAANPVLTQGAGNKVDIVMRKVGVANETSEDAKPDAALTNTYWRIVRLGDLDVQVADGRREPHIILRQIEGNRRYSATVGCNQIGGTFSVEGESLILSQGISTRMACLPPLDALEQRLITMLSETKSFRIAGDRLELFDASGASIALFEAVYL